MMVLKKKMGYLSSSVGKAAAVSAKNSALTMNCLCNRVMTQKVYDFKRHLLKKALHWSWCWCWCMEAISFFVLAVVSAHCCISLNIGNYYCYGLQRNKEEMCCYNSVSLKTSFNLMQSILPVSLNAERQKLSKE